MKLYLCYNTDSETICFAVSEFCRHLACCMKDIDFIHNPKILTDDAAVPKIIFEAPIEHQKQLCDDYYHICVQKNGGSISGSNERSVLLGVYAYLRKLGFRFLLPQKTYVPSKLSYTDLFMEFSHHASLHHRGVCIEGADSLENALAFIDWLPKLGFNSFFLQFHEPYIFLERWYHHHLNPLASPAQYNDPPKLTDAFLQSCYEKLNDEIKKRSILTHAVGHGWTCKTIGLPSVGWVIEDKEPSAEHKNMLALVNGKRAYIGSVPMNTNLCYANPTAIEQFCQCVVSYIEEHPNVDYLHVWLADGTNHICECEACQKTTPTDQYIRLLNEIDRRLTEKALDCKLVFLLYQELLFPPKEEHFLNPDRFTLMFAPITRTFKQSYPDHITAVSLPAYNRNRIKLPVTIQENLSYLHGWQQQIKQTYSGKLDSLVYDYPLGRAHYGDLGYVSISKILAGDIQNIKKLGLYGYISCQELRAFLPNGLPNYVMGYLTLDEEETFEQLMEEYFSAAYGSSYQKAMEYLSKVSDLSDCDYVNSIGARINPALHEQYKQLLTYAASFSAFIKEQVQTCKDIHTFFWELLDYHNGYVIRLTKALIALTAGELTTANDAYADFCQYVRENEPMMQPYLDVFRIIDVTTNYTGFTLPEKRK